MDEQWYLATRRLWVGVLVRTFFASVVVWPTVATIALLVTYLGFGSESSAFFFLTLPLGIVINLLALLWAIRQSLQQQYPQGVFRLVSNESPHP